LTTVWSSEW